MLSMALFQRRFIAAAKRSAGVFRFGKRARGYKRGRIREQYRVRSIRGYGGVTVRSGKTDEVGCQFRL